MLMLLLLSRVLSCSLPGGAVVLVFVAEDLETEGRARARSTIKNIAHTRPLNIQKGGGS